VASKGRLFALTTEGEVRFDLLRSQEDREKINCQETLTGEVRCFSLDDLSVAAEAAAAGRPLALAAATGTLWLRKPKHRRSAYPRPSQPICLHGLQLFYTAPGSTRVERMGAASHL